MQFASYIVSETRTAFSVPLTQEIPIKKSFKQKAFTLAETLITLSIIGVIAAMTVPTLMSNMNKQIYVTGLKKAYNQLQNAVKTATLDRGCSSGDFECAMQLGTIYPNANAYYFNAEDIERQFKVTKTLDDCDNIYKSSYGIIFEKCFQTEDGSKYYFTGGHTSPFNYIGVDINGDKGPNKVGIDFFAFEIVSKNTEQHKIGTVLPVGHNAYPNYCTTQSIQSGADGFYCTAKVLKENAMNY